MDAICFYTSLGEPTAYYSSVILLRIGQCVLILNNESWMSAQIFRADVCNLVCLRRVSILNRRADGIILLLPIGGRYIVDAHYYALKSLLSTLRLPGSDTFVCVCWSRTGVYSCCLAVLRPQLGVRSIYAYRRRAATRCGDYFRY